MPEYALSQVTVKEIHNLIVENPSLIKKNAKLDEIIAKIIEDPRTRHVYVIDNNGKLLGSIRLNNIIECMFPQTSFNTSVETKLTTKGLFQFKLSILAMDIMNTQPIYVFEETTIPDLVKIMIRENINELPVVNKDLIVIGEVNFLEIMTHYLKTQKKENNNETY